MFHKFITVMEAEEGVDAIVQCFKCGGSWYSTPEDNHEGFSRGYLNAIGDDANDCTGNTNQYHHFATECSCPGECIADPECNCLQCL